MKPPKPKGATAPTTTTPNVEGMHARIRDRAATKNLQIRMPENLSERFKILAILKKTTPEKLAISLIETTVNKAEQEE